MSFKLPNMLPSPRATPSELADFAELKVLLKGRCSATDIQRYLSRVDDNEPNEGIQDSDVENEKLSDAMMVEIGYRKISCQEGYPFETDDKTGSILQIRSNTNINQDLVYRYLLFATRLNMLSQKVFEGIDGTQLMEDLCAVTLRRYLGEKSRSDVFATARRGGFEAKISDLCGALKEGGRYRNIDGSPTQANDDGLDIVGWIPFSDGLPAKISIFGQCKTGTSWDESLSRLNPSAFVKNWMTDPIVVDPVRAYFVAEAADRSRWKRNSLYGGILFDRCRLVDLADLMEPELLERISTWTEAALEWLREAWD